MGTMHVLDTTGHTDITWDTQVEEEVAVARDEFEKLLCGGRMAFSDEGLVREFDPGVKELTVIPLMVGG